MENARSTRHDLLQQLTQTSAETPMGKLLRTFWQPVAVGEARRRGQRARCAC